MAEAKNWGADLNVDIDLGNVRRRRREAPLVKEARLALLARELNRLAAEDGDLWLAIRPLWM